MTQKRFERIARTLSAGLKRRRRELGLNQEDVAHLLGIVPRQYQKIESGKTNVTLRTIARLAAVLKINPKDLF